MQQSLFEALKARRPLAVVGVINAYCARLAQQSGHRAIYLSGAGVANASFGLPDLGMTSLPDVVEDVRRITGTTDLPLLVDADTGWGDALGIARTTTQLYRAGAAGMHLEDQVAAKRCGHRPDKQLVSCQQMVDRIRSAVDARPDERFMIMARTDAAESEGSQGAMDRASAYVDAGADAIFAEALAEPLDFQTFTAALDVPVLANMTEFGKTPLMTLAELGALGVSIVLYPLSAFRAMSQAASNVYQAIEKHGTQKDMLSSMQTRESLYDVLEYYAFEDKLNKLSNVEKDSHD